MVAGWQPFVSNFAIVALFILGWVHAQFIFEYGSKRFQRIAFGITMGLGGVLEMLMAFPYDGVLFDLRLSLIALASFFGGPLSGGIAVAITVAFRAGVIGGPAVLSASAATCVVAVMGLVVSHALRGRVPALVSAIVLAVGVAGVSFGWIIMLRVLTNGRPLPLPTLVALINTAALNGAATLLSTFFVMRQRVLERERDLLHAAFLSSPDLQYVKTTDSKFAAVNEAVARHHGFKDPAAMIGKSDYDIDEPERARALMAAERKLLDDGVPLTDVEELVVSRDGQKTWFLTSKVPLHDRDGKVIGLAGVTRDITAPLLLRQEVTESRNQLNYVLTEIIDGMAMYDKNHILVYCNERYRALFPKTSSVRVPGAALQDILKAVVASGEQVGIPAPDADNVDDWIASKVATLMVAGEQELELADGRWLHVRTRPTREGAAMLVVSDVSEIKQAEASLLAMTAQLKLLATTDGLTGLNNRRAFDQALEIELARAQRTGLPMSLIMVDVDRFKRYNDLYGHQAGDEALKAVAQCFRSACARPGDFTARYGGEEFIAILPGADEDGACFIADAFRDSVHLLGIPHSGSGTGAVAASAGVATLSGTKDEVSGAEMVRRADEALYNAKGAGRDRVVAWRPDGAMQERTARPA